MCIRDRERWVSNVVMRGEIEDSEYAMIFLQDITESKAETARRMQMASDNASMDLLIKIWCVCWTALSSAIWRMTGIGSIICKVT